ncbi:hypothetical protein AAMO2058_000404500 [Amorphochlora amoebiformis]
MPRGLEWRSVDPFPSSAIKKLFFEASARKLFVSAESFEYYKGKKAVRLSVEDGKGGRSYTEVALFGAHVMKFTQVSADGKETPLMWTTKKAVFDGSRAIRGGVPLIFPQFNKFGPMSAHGFARTAMFSLEGITSDLDTPSITANLKLSTNEVSKEMWGKEIDFSLNYLVTLQGAPDEKSSSSLTLDMQVTNKGKVDLGFTCALHTYFPVSDITKAVVTAALPGDSIKGMSYIDQLAEGKTRADKIVKQETDEIALQVVDKATGLRIVQETNFTDAVVWNPWVDKAKRMAAKDYEENEYKQMVCVEVAEVGTAGNKVTLKPGEVFKRYTKISSTV